MSRRAAWSWRARAMRRRVRRPICRPIACKAVRSASTDILERAIGDQLPHTIDEGLTAPFPSDQAERFEHATDLVDQINPYLDQAGA